MNDLVRTLPCREEGPRTGSQCCDHPADLWGFVGICFRSRAVLSSCVMWMEAGAVWAGGGRQRRGVDMAPPTVSQRSLRMSLPAPKCPGNWRSGAAFRMPRHRGGSL